MRSSEGKYLGVFALSPKTKKQRVRPSGFSSTSARGRSCICKGEPSSVKRSKTEAMASRSASRTLRISFSNSSRVGSLQTTHVQQGQKSFARTCCPSWKLMYPLSSLSTSFAMASSLSALILYPKYLRSRWHLSRTFHGFGMFQPSLLTRRETSSTGISCVSAISFLAISLWLPAPWHFEMARGRRCGFQVKLALQAADVHFS